MAALAGAGVHNAIVEVDGPELPVLDGSAANFAVPDRLRRPRRSRADTRPVRDRGAAAGAGGAMARRFAELRPQPRRGLDWRCRSTSPRAAIGRQALSLRLTPASFRAELARARTFTLAGEIEQLRAAGLALGGSLDNAVVVDGDRVLNPAGLRMPDEFVRHKLLDAVGDLALAGAPLRGRFVGHRSGHALNNRLLRALFADAANWRAVPRRATPMGPASGPLGACRPRRACRLPRRRRNLPPSRKAARPVV